MQNLPQLRKFILLAFLLFSVPVSVKLAPVLSDEIENISNEIEDTEREIKTKEKILEEAQAQINDILSSNLTLDQKIAALESEITLMEEKIALSEADLAQKAEAISIKEAEIEAKNESLKKVTQNLYKSSKVTTLEIALSQNSGSDLLRSFVYKRYAFNSLSSSIRGLDEEVDALNSEKAVLAYQKSLLDEEKAALQSSKDELNNQKALILQQLYAKAAQQSNLEKDLIALNNKMNELSSDLQQAILNKAGSGGDSSGGGNSNGGGSPQPPSGDAGTYDIYAGCEIVGGNYEGCEKVAENVPGPVRALSTDSNNVFRVEQAFSYRGVLEFRADTNVYLINELPFEQYLFGIAEVPSSWPVESLKAQAVAARTYAAKNWNKRSGDKYNLRSDTYDQHYVGYGKESEAGYGQNWVNAVTGTSSQVITYDGSMISAYYHSTCGGHTLGSEEVWVSALPYTRPKSDWYQSGEGWRSYDEASPWSYKKWGTTSIDDNQMIDLINASIYLAADPNSGTRQNNIRRSDLGGWSAGQIEEALGSGKMQDRIGTLLNVESVYNNGSTAIDSSAKATSKVRITGSAGTLEIDWYVFWVVFNSRSPGDLTLYWSNFWTSVKEGGSWNFYLRGYPHRVGMCQYGAYGRAQAGQSYSTILAHYYEGTSLGEFAPPAQFRVGITSLGDGDIYVENSIGGVYSVYANGTFVRGFGASETMRIVKK